MVAPAATSLRLTRGVLAGIVVSIALAVAIAWISLSLEVRDDHWLSHAGPCR
ncbi:hypothetical protein [Mesorhizobium kowhaii]|uniref:hypothetical protein n=1 Tax=Mesorhizobium kowhaii TaxID=1300272 RepID=UPI001ABF00D9|nr:hypothetical protein [Mesorhizobium kowhaii]